MIAPNSLGYRVLGASTDLPSTTALHDECPNKPPMATVHYRRVNPF